MITSIKKSKPKNITKNIIFAFKIHETMSKRLGIVWGNLSRYKYLIVIVAGTLSVGVAGENSFLQHIRYQIQINGLRMEIDKYQTRIDADSMLIEQMGHGVGAYERIARERYFMKADDEDVFVLSTDLNTDNDKNTDQ